MNSIVIPFFLACAVVTALAVVFPLRVLLSLLPVTPIASTAPWYRQTAVGQSVAWFILILCSSSALYAILGNAAALAPASLPTAPAVSATPVVGPQQILAMVERLAARLQKQPDDVEGWRRLARSYESLGRFDLAVGAYQQLSRLRPDDADVLTDYAVTLAMSMKRSLSGEPEQLLRRALAINPAHIQALALMGSAAFERQDYRAAVLSWKKILAQLPPEEEMAVSIAASISKAEQLAARKPENAQGTSAQ